MKLKMKKNQITLLIVSALLSGQYAYAAGVTGNQLPGTGDYEGIAGQAGITVNVNASTPLIQNIDTNTTATGGTTGAGLFVNGGSLTLTNITNNGKLKGGDNAGYTAGNGAYIEYLTLTDFINNGVILGGSGNMGGDGLVLEAVTISNLVNNNLIQGGNKTNSRGTGLSIATGSNITVNNKSSGQILGGIGSGGAGANGIYVDASKATINNDGVIKGGYSPSSTGGAGVYVTGGSSVVKVVNTGTIDAGNSTASIYIGGGGAINIVNSGMISKGNGSDAIFFNSWALDSGSNDIHHTMELQTGSVIDGKIHHKVGYVDFVLNGTASTGNNIFDLSSLYTEFTGNFDDITTFTKKGTHDWVLTGATGTNITTNWTVTDGTLVVADSANIKGNITVNSGAKLGTHLATVNGTVTMKSGSTMTNYGKKATLDALDLSAGNTTLTISGVTDQTQNLVLIDTSTGITGSFTDISIGGSHIGPVDYLTVQTYIQGKQLIANYDLSWDANNNQRHGTFTLTDADDEFVIDKVLTNVTPNTSPSWDGKSLTKAGDGTLILNKTNTYTGLTDIQAGKLIVGQTTADSTATIAGAVDIQDGATLSGFGTVGGKVTVNSGATLAAGNGNNGFGTLTVGSVDFLSGATYQVNVDETGNFNQLISNGNVDIAANTTLDIQAAAGTWAQDRTYTIIDARNGGSVSGEFDPLTTNLAFLTATTDYSSGNQVKLTMKRNSSGFSSVAQSHNQKYTGAAIESLGQNNALYQQVVSMSADQASSAYDNLSGEIHASVKSVALVNSVYTRNAVNQHLEDGIGILTNQLDSNRGVWLSTWGHKGHIKADGNAAKVDNDSWGTLLGIDLYQSDGADNTVLGVAAGYGSSDIKIDNNRHSSADMDATHLLAYGRTSVDNFHFKGMIGYSWLDIDTRRHVNVGSVSGTNKASYDGSLLQANAEASYQFKPSEIARLSPYFNLGYMRVKTDSFTEKGNSDSSAARLHNRGEGDDIFTSTIGLKTQWLLSDITTIYTDLGWMHTYGSNSPETTLNFIGGDNYTLKGAEVDRNSAIIGLGVQFQFTPATQLSLGYEALSGDQTKNHGAQAKFEYYF